MYFGQKLSALLKQKRMTQRSLAETLEVNVQAINRYIKSDRQPRLSFIKRVAHTLKVPVSYFVNDFVDSELPEDNKAIFEFVKLPVIGILDKKTELRKAEEFMDEIFIHKKHVENKKETFAIKAASKDMVPAVQPEDYVVVSKTRRLKPNDLVMFRNIKSGEFHIRHFMKVQDSIVLTSKNSSIDPIVLDYKDFMEARDAYEYFGKITYQVRAHNN